MAPTLQFSRRRAAALLTQQIRNGYALLKRGQDEVTEELRLEGDSWSNRNKELLERMFGDPRYRHDYIAAILANKPRLAGADEHKVWVSGLKVRINFVKGVLDRLDLISIASGRHGSESVRNAPRNVNKRSHDHEQSVFIVHGHNAPLKRKIIKFLKSLDFEPVVLGMRAGASDTLLEKIERERPVYAVVLLTGDDEGRKCPSGAAGKARLNPRARQNVIFEWGFFIGRLGRGKVRALYEPDVELPSDLGGVDWTEIDRRGAWRESLERELGAALRRSTRKKK